MSSEALLRELGSGLEVPTQECDSGLDVLRQELGSGLEALMREHDTSEEVLTRELGSGLEVLTREHEFGLDAQVTHETWFCGLKHGDKLHVLASVPWMPMVMVL